MLGWSDERLTGAERPVLRILADSAGDCTLEAAEAEGDEEATSASSRTPATPCDARHAGVYTLILLAQIRE